MVSRALTLPGSVATWLTEYSIFQEPVTLKHTKNIFCGVPQGSILGPLLFLLYVNDFYNSTALDPIMFADDTNLFYEHNDLKTLFSLVNQELQKINEWFEANKLYFKVERTNFFSINQVEEMIFLSCYLNCWSKSSKCFARWKSILERSY